MGAHQGMVRSDVGEFEVKDRSRGMTQLAGVNDNGPVKAQHLVQNLEANGVQNLNTQIKVHFLYALGHLYSGTIIFEQRIADSYDHCFFSLFLLRAICLHQSLLLCHVLRKMGRMPTTGMSMRPGIDVWFS
jgi:hypothetical protein